MGGASRWTSPLREQKSPWPPDGGPYHLAPLVAASQQIVGSNAEVVRHFHQSRHIRIMPAALIILVLASTDFKNSSHLCLCLARLLAQLSDPLCKIFHAPPLDLQFNFVYIVNTKLNYDFGDDSS